MPPDFKSRLGSFAEVIVGIGLNLQRGQRLLIAEPYELQGVARSAEVIIEAVRAVAFEAGCPHPVGVEVIWGDSAQFLGFARNADWREFSKLAEANARMMQAYMKNGDALLFLQGSQPRLMEGLPADTVAELRRIGWEHFGPVAGQLTAGATNWTVAPAPSPAWAQTAYADLPAEQRLAALWEQVFTAMRTNGPAPTGAWQIHLQKLRQRCDELNARRLPKLHYKGGGTNLTVALPGEHVWCTAQLTTKSGLRFVANMPTEEIFTAPHRDSATGTVHVARPISYGGAVIAGIELEFKHGRVVAARARTGGDLLQRLLDADEGASRLGEVAIVPETNALNRARRLFYHPLLDENSMNHIALGNAYEFCLRAQNHTAQNRSLIHVDLPFEAQQLLPEAELS